jgi:hypothetical protein
MKKELTKKTTKLRIEKIPISTLDDLDVAGGTTGFSCTYACCGTRAGDCNPNGPIYTNTCHTPV